MFQILKGCMLKKGSGASLKINEVPDLHEAPPNLIFVNEQKPGDKKVKLANLIIFLS